MGQALKDEGGLLIHDALRHDRPRPCLGEEVSAASCSPLQPRQQEHGIERGSYATVIAVSAKGNSLTRRHPSRQLGTIYRSN